MGLLGKGPALSFVDNMNEAELWVPEHLNWQWYKTDSGKNHISHIHVGRWFDLCDVVDVHCEQVLSRLGGRTNHSVYNWCSQTCGRRHSFGEALNQGESLVKVRWPLLTQHRPLVQQLYNVTHQRPANSSDLWILQPPRVSTAQLRKHNQHRKDGPAQRLPNADKSFDAYKTI